MLLSFPMLYGGWLSFAAKELSTYPIGTADKNEGTVVRRPVEILERGEKTVLLRGDLQDGDAVVAVRVSGIRDGMPARLDTTPASAPAPEKAVTP